MIVNTFRINKYDLLRENQSGFIRKHSCQTALIHLVDKWFCNINENTISSALFIDFAKAFGVIVHMLR